MRPARFGFRPPVAHDEQIERLEKDRSEAEPEELAPCCQAIYDQSGGLSV